MATSQKLEFRSGSLVESNSGQLNYSISGIVEKYRDWVSEDKFMIFNRVKFKAVHVRDSRTNKSLISRFPISSETFAVKCSKRGNDVYRHRVYCKFKGLASLAEKTVFFNPKDRNQKNVFIPKYALNEKDFFIIFKKFTLLNFFCMSFLYDYHKQ